MALDVTGAALGSLIAQALVLPPAPANPSPAQLVAYNTAVTAQLATWTTVAAQIITYLVANTQVITNDTVPGLGLIAPPGMAGGPVTGTAMGSGIGTIK